MTHTQLMRSAGKTVAYGAGIAASAYAAYIGTTWVRYGHVDHPAGEDTDSLLDLFMPNYEVADRHQCRVHAPAAVTFAASCDLDLQRSPIVRAIFKGRELALGSRAGRPLPPRGIVALTKSMGWGVLAEIAGTEIVMGAVTQPWNADVIFRALPPAEFAAFAEPQFVKIAWTLRADRISGTESIARTETRVMTTDPVAREKFRRYWSIFSPGILLIRRVGLRQTRLEAERRARERRVPDRFDLVSAGDLDPEC